MFGSLRIGPQTKPVAAALALDLTTEAIILHERTAQGEWKKFASVRLDDSEFPIVIGLLRDEAEAHTGKPLPVRLWLPGEQVLKLRAHIRDGSPSARLRAGFDYIDYETAYRSEDVAIAVAPAGRDGETTVLITFVETWREARDYATRWGFFPGELSTRHHCTDFGAAGPVFHLKSPPPNPDLPNNQRRMAVAALALVTVAGGAAVWSLGPWGSNPAGPGPSTGTGAVEVASTPSAAAAPNSGPLTAPEPTLRVQASPPQHFPNIPAPDAPADTDLPPRIITALKAPYFSVPAIAIAAPAEIAAAPSPPPALEPEPPGRDPVVRWTGPLAVLEPPWTSSAPNLQAYIEALKPRSTWREQVSLIANSASSSQPPAPVPVVELPPAEPVDIAIEAIKPVAPEPAAPVVVLAPSDEVERAEPSELVASAEPTAPLVQPEPTGVATPPYPAPIPAPRPGRAAPGITGTGILEEQSAAIEDQPAARVIPVPRSSRAGATERHSPTATGATVVDQATTETPPEPVSGTQTETGQEVPGEPAKFASATSPLPASRPAIAARPRELPSPAILPALTGTANSSTRSAATEPGMPLDVTMLVGILNLEDGRKALLRLPDGSYRYVIVGDVLDGWRVSLIGVDAMRITRSGEQQTLLLVNR